MPDPVSQPSAKQYVSPMPPMGIWVHWFQGASKTGHCWPAIVMKANVYDSTELLVFKGVGFERRNCKHIDNPKLKTLDHRGKQIEGAWDFIPGAVNDLNNQLSLNGEGSVADIRRELAAACQKMDALRKDIFGDPEEDDIEDRILKVARLHPDNAHKIAEVCACPVQKVQAVLQRAKRHQAEEAK